MELGYDKFEARDLAKIIWSLGQFGPAILKIKPQNGYPDAKELVFKLIGKGFEYLMDMDVWDLTRFLHGITNLHIILESENHEKIHSFLKVNVNVADPVSLFRIPKFMAERQIPIEDDLLKTLVLRCETKIKINKFGLTEMMSLLNSLGQMANDRHIFQSLCGTIEESVILALRYCLTSQNAIFSLMHIKQCMHGFVNLDYMPDDVFFDVMSNYIIKFYSCSKDAIKFDVMMDYAEFGKIPDAYFDLAKIKIKSFEKKDSNYNLERIWGICEAMAILEYLDLETFEAALRYSDKYIFTAKTSDRIRVYNCILHMKYVLKIKSNNYYD